MSWIDIIFIAISIYAIVVGFRNGLVSELCGLIGLVIGGYVAYKYCKPISQWLNMDFEHSYILAFILLLIAVIVLVRIISKVISSLVRATGFGVINSILGATISFFKISLLLSLLYLSLDAVNATTGLVPQGEISKSKTYRPVRALAGIFFPYMHFLGDYYDAVKDRIDQTAESIEDIVTTKTEAK